MERLDGHCVKELGSTRQTGFAAVTSSKHLLIESFNCNVFCFFEVLWQIHLVAYKCEDQKALGQISCRLCTQILLANAAVLQRLACHLELTT